MIRHAVATFGIGLAAIACLPGPDEPVEYLDREDTVVMQLRTGAPGDEASSRIPPDFTLYGDGTMIYSGIDADGDPGLLQVALPADAVRDLLEFAVDRGFLDLYYDQAGDDDGPVTFLYVSTRAGTNSVRAADLDPDAQGAAGTIAVIVEHLRAFDPVAQGGSVPEAFVAEGLVLSVYPVAEFEGGAGSPIIWPFGDVDLAGVRGELILDGEGPSLGSAVGVLAPPPFTTTVQQDGRFYEVGVRPLLPFEENFPEFDLP